ncbi:MAG: LysM peptidoglycan-binding domain-containing protein, partial [Actinomycetes bacterium]
VALLLVGLAVLLAVVLLGGSPLAPPASGDMQRVALQQVTVLPGQTLWSIADSTEPTGDIRDRIAEIRALNNLESSSLVAGQQLLVPLG